MKVSLEHVVFIVNPNSGKRTGKIISSLLKFDKDINYFLSNNIAEFDAFFTSIDKYKVVVICGGDGTINNTLKYIADKNNIKLAVLPNGSGNGFARELGFKNDIKGLIDQITKGKTEKVDLVKVNNDYSCNVMGLGIDSYIASEFATKTIRGLKTYIYCTAKALVNYKPIEAEITVNDSTIKGVYQMINIANTRQFGNNAIIAPKAKYNDKLLDLVLVKPIPVYLIPIYTYKLFTGRLNNSRYVQFIKTKEVTIKSNSRSYHLDGEPKAMLQPLNICVGRQIDIVKTY